MAPSSVRVAVLNGSGRSGEAAKAGSDLQRQGFQVSSMVSANNFNYTTSVIRYRAGSADKAQLLASAVQGGTQLQDDSSIQGADVELITGQSYQGISPVPAHGDDDAEGRDRHHRPGHASDHHLRAARHPGRVRSSRLLSRPADPPRTGPPRPGAALSAVG